MDISQGGFKRTAIAATTGAALASAYGSALGSAIFAPSRVESFAYAILFPKLR